jgi:hypothetical protein
MRLVGAASIAVGVVMLATFATCPKLGGDATAVAAESEVPSWVKQARLWRQVPTKKFATLGEGAVRTVGWGAYVYRWQTPNGRPLVCIEEANLSKSGLLSSGSECGELAPPSRYPIYTLAATSSNGKGASVFALAVGVEVTRVKLDFGPGPSQTRATKLLSEAQATKANVPRLRYLAFGLGRFVCLRGMSGFGSGGAKVVSTPHVKCDSSKEWVVPHR